MTLSRMDLAREELLSREANALKAVVPLMAGTSVISVWREHDDAARRRVRARR